MVSFFSISSLVLVIAALVYTVINLASEQLIIGLGVGVIVFGVLYLAKENRDSFS